MNSANQIIISLEGIDGSGKSTLIKKIGGELQNEVLVYSRTSKGKFLDKLLSSKLMNHFYWIQIPFYFYLSYKNFWKLGDIRKYKIIIMDRCFLSNICYFYPKVMHDLRSLQVALSFEVKLFPQKIFVLDVDPAAGQKRDNYKKRFDWLKQARKNYIDSANAELLQKFHIQVIDKDLSDDKKIKIILTYLHNRLFLEC